MNYSIIVYILGMDHERGSSLHVGSQYHSPYLP